MDDLNEAFKKKKSTLINRKQIILHHDNACCFGDSPENHKTRLGNSVAPFPRPSTIPLLSVSLHPKFFEGKKVLNEAGINQALLEFFASKSEFFYRIESNYHHAGKRS